MVGYISGIRQLLKNEKPDTHFIGLAGYDDIETYASILAIWAEGYAFVPLSLQNPASRNTNILQQLNCSLVLSSRGYNSNLFDKNIYSLSLYFGSSCKACTT